MATLQIRIRNGEFISTNSVGIKSEEKQKIKGNGWNCRINEVGEVICSGAFYLRGKKYWIKFALLEDGYSELTVTQMGKAGNGTKIREKIKTFPLDGTIYLPVNYNATSRPFFRETIDLDNFLKKHGLTAVLDVNPNGKYRLIQKRDGSNITYEDEITSNGTEKIQFKGQEIDKSNTQKIAIFAEAQVTEATWVVRTTKKNGEIAKRILCTKVAPEKIEGLPKFE